MSLIVIILVGGLVGWIAAMIAGRDEGFWGSVLIGIVGAFIGGFLSMVITGDRQSYWTLSWGGVFWSLIGALLVVLIINGLSGRSTRPTPRL